MSDQVNNKEVTIYEKKIIMNTNFKEETEKELIKSVELAKSLQNESINARSVLVQQPTTFNVDAKEQLISLDGELFYMGEFMYSRVMVPVKDLERAREFVNSELFNVKETDIPYDMRMTNYEYMKNIIEKEIEKKNKYTTQKIALVFLGIFALLILLTLSDFRPEFIFYMFILIGYACIEVNNNYIKSLKDSNSINDYEREILTLITEDISKGYEIENLDSREIDKTQNVIFGFFQERNIKAKNTIKLKKDVTFSEVEFFKDEVLNMRGLYLEIKRETPVSKNICIMDNEFAELFGFDISGDELENKDVNIETLVNQIFKKTYLEIIEENEDNSDNKVVCWKNKREIFELYLKHRGEIMIAIEKDKISIFIYGGKLLYYPNPKNCVQINTESILNNYEKMMQVVEDYIKVLENLEIVNIETKIK